GAPISVTDRQITEALVDAGLVAYVRDGWRTDIVIELDDDPSAPYAWERGCYLIDQGIEKLETGIKQGRIDHVSVFALTYIPWLVYLGSRLDDTLTVRVFDHDRKGRDRAWCWKQPTRPPVSWVFEVNGGGTLVDSVGWLHSVTAGVGWPGFGNRRRCGPRA